MQKSIFIKSIAKNFRFIFPSSRKKRIALLFIFLTLFLSIYLITPSKLSKHEALFIKKVLSPISKEEEKELRNSFKTIYSFSGVVYTLFGSKPMSIDNLLTYEGNNTFETWEKIQDSFSSQKYIIRKVKFRFPQYDFFLTVNLPEIERVYIENEDVFKDRDISLERLKERFLYEKPLLLLEELKEDHVLLGILFGYGRHNAEMFAKNATLPKSKRKIFEAFTDLNATFIFQHFFSPCILPCFVCDPNHPETIALREKYTRERKHIVKLSRKYNLFDLMLLRLDERYPSKEGEIK